MTAEQLRIKRKNKRDRRINRRAMWVKRHGAVVKSQSRRIRSRPPATRRGLVNRKYQLWREKTDRAHIIKMYQMQYKKARGQSRQRIVDQLKELGAKP